ncbi:MAG: hypothetical protein QOE70_5976 [Chthoniobacter sp.]|jgi:hypothetical protein|nr:hypothetical protein [Chthoniobacter sp.]
MQRIAIQKPFRALALRLSLAVWMLLLPSAWAVPPAWWSARGVNQTGTADDYAVANVGQMKNLVRAARDEFNARLTGGAGSPLTSLVQSWLTPPAPPAPQPQDFATLTQGQLKATVKVVYDRLLAAGKIPPYVAANPYPWSASTADDNSYTLVTLGQLKYVFDFDLVNTDRDGDGLPDLFELVVFGTSPGLADSDHNGISDGIEDADGDRIGNADEVAFGLNPLGNDSNVSARREAFTYDRLGRLRSEQKQTAPVRRVSVDPEGNITTIN